jgi:hypothetical protein
MMEFESYIQHTAAACAAAPPGGAAVLSPCSPVIAAAGCSKRARLGLGPVAPAAAATACHSSDGRSCCSLGTGLDLRSLEELAQCAWPGARA